MVLSPIKFSALAFVLALFPTAPVLSLHETDHQYDITGYVLSTDKQAIAGAPVVAHLDGKRLGSGRSDSTGYYRFRVHLHDTDVGRELRLKTPEGEGIVRVSLTPGDKSTQRIHHVNFIGGELVEGNLSGQGGISTSTMVAGALAVTLLASIFAAGYVRRMRRRKKRAERKATKAQDRSATQRRKRKKHNR
jgi:hypothetical protein